MAGRTARVNPSNEPPMFFCYEVMPVAFDHATLILRETSTTPQPVDRAGVTEGDNATSPM